MNSPEKITDEEVANQGKRKFKLPFWALGIGLIFPPAWPFLIIALLMSYPKTSAVTAGSTAALIFGLGIMNQIGQKQEQDKLSKDKVALLGCRAKYKDASNLPSSDAKCMSLIAASDKEAKAAAEREAQVKRIEALKKDRADAEAKEREESTANSTAELSCRKAVRESLTTTDGYHIPLGSVKTAPHAGHEGQYVTKFPFSVKNAFGVRMDHAVECVATGTGDIVFVNQLY